MAKDFVVTLFLVVGEIVGFVIGVVTYPVILIIELIIRFKERNNK